MPYWNPPFLGQRTKAKSQSVVVASDQGNLPVASPDTVTAGTITTATPGAGNTVAAAASGYGGWAVGISGTWAGTLVFEGTIDGTNWFAINGQAIGVLTNIAAPNTTANGQWRGVATDLVQVRVRATAWTSGTATITFDLSANPGILAMLAALPPGTNAIGAVNPAAGAAVAASSPPATTNAGSDTPYTFATAVTHVLIQNNTAAALYIDFNTPATAGAIEVYAGGQAVIFDVPCATLHLWTAAATAINGTTAGAIVVRGWA